MLYIDMDGVLAKWDPTATAEETHQKGFFLSRELEPVVAELISFLTRKGIPFSILSSVYSDGSAREEKEKWLQACGLEYVPRIFVPYGEKKSRYVHGTGHVLIDDYSHNLHEWESCGNIGIKFLNGLNGRKKTWTGFSISRDMPVSLMIDIIEMAKTKQGAFAS